MVSTAGRMAEIRTFSAWLDTMIFCVKNAARLSDQESTNNQGIPVPLTFPFVILTNSRAFAIVFRLAVTSGVYIDST